MAAVILSLLLTIISTTGVITDALTVTLEPAKPSNVKPGEDFTLACVIDGELNGAPINFIKEVHLPDGTNHSYLISHSILLADGVFKSSSRYTATIDSNSLILNIKGVTFPDTGHIGCNLPTANITKTSLLNVIGNPTEVEITSPATNKVYKAKPNEGIAVSCLSKNSHPEAGVKMIVGNTDVTDQFKKTTNFTSGYTASYNSALSDVIYTTKLEADNFALPSLYAGKKLMCTATVGNLDPKTDFITIKMDDVPRVTCPKEVITTRKRDPKIECKVSSSLKLLTPGGIKWAFHKNNVDVPVTEFKVNEFGVPEDENGKLVTLSYSGYLPNNLFGNYTLTATNTVGAASATTYLGIAGGPRAVKDNGVHGRTTISTFLFLATLSLLLVFH